MDTKEQASVTYVLNTKSKKIHYPDCKAVADMNEENKEETHKTIKELTGKGYEPCGICKPK
jgi:DNA-entry nuclease